MKILIDTNIILDFLLQREPFRQDSEDLFRSIDSGQVIGYVTASSFTDIFYIAQKHTRSKEKAREAIARILTIMIICPVNRTILESAFAFGYTDFEHAVQIACAIAERVDAILTRDQAFQSSSIPIWSIRQLLSELEN